MNKKIKAILISFFSLLIIWTASAFSPMQYNTVEEFEAAEWHICEAATDNCNNYFLVDGEIKGGTLMACQDVDTKWSCTKYIAPVFSTVEEFEKEEWAICKSASDGCNTFVVSEGKVTVWTLMSCPALETKIWFCKDYIEEVETEEVKSYDTLKEFEDAEWLTCTSATDWCNTFIVSYWKVTAWTLKACEEHIESWSCLKKDEMLNVLWEKELDIYLKIKWWALVPDAIRLIWEYTEKYMEKLSKMSNTVKKNNLDALITSIEIYITNIAKAEKNPRLLEVKLYVLQQLKFNVQKEVYDLNNLIKEEEKEIKKMHPSWDSDNDWINDCEKEDTCDDSVDYSLPRE